MWKKILSFHFLLILVIIFFVIIVTVTFYARSNTLKVEQFPSSSNVFPEDNVNLTRLWVKPQATDKDIDDWLEPHYVVKNNSTPSQQKLLVFFSGSFGIPARQQLIIEQAARMGYDAINLRYPNSWIVGKLCRHVRNLDCYGDIRHEILTGNDHSPLIKVNRANSIENRLVKLLQYLDWQEYLQTDALKWDSIVVAGHSQGGAQAFFIAQQYLVAKAIAFAAPVDYNPRQGDFANWLKRTNQTPPERYYGFVHRQDRGFRKIRQAWKLLQLDQFGDLINVDRTMPPYNNSHQLVTLATPALKDKHHGSVVVDKATPLSPDGKLLLLDVWKYLLQM